MSGSILARWIDFVLMKPLRHLVERPERMLRHHVKPGMTVLDVGCGDGLYSIGMARLVGSSGRVISVDLRAEAIEALKKRVAGSPLSRRIEPRLCSERTVRVRRIAGPEDPVIPELHIQFFLEDRLDIDLSEYAESLLFERSSHALQRSVERRIHRIVK